MIPKQYIAVLALLLAFALPAAAGGGGGGDGLYIGDIGQAIASLIIFGLLLLVLGKWAWKPIIAQLQRREQRIAETIKNAEDRQAQADALLEEYRQKLAAADAEVADVLASARKDAAAAREQILQAARAEAGRIAEQSTTEIEQAKSVAIRDLYEQAAVLATDVAGKIIRKQLKPDDQKQMLQDALAEIKQRAGK
ncbi:MAG: F0F1 ATP synthase subunit B [Phycisphaerae bacterium]|nr:F0F1 ATP synthase subunit B [Phycisphaerae bacterium]